MVLYGLKSSPLDCRNHLSDILGNYIGLNYSPPDPDVWYISAVENDSFE